MAARSLLTVWVTEGGRAETSFAEAIGEDTVWSTCPGGSTARTAKADKKTMLPARNLASSIRMGTNGWLIIVSSY